MKRMTIFLLVLANCGKVHGLVDGGPEDSSVAADAVPLPPDAPACIADSMYCGSGSAVYICNTAGTAGTKVQDCEHGCATGVCNACAPGTTFCNGADLSMCDSNGNIAGTTLC